MVKLGNEALLIVFAGLILLGCGGGGDDSASTAPTPPPSGSAPPPPPPPDADSDGVADSNDICPNTANNASVNAQGCSDEQLDDDNDSVSNALDQCPLTPQNEQVDAAGCGIATQNGGTEEDLDADGVVNTADICDDTPRRERVDQQGCSESQKDNDGDGITNDIDVCDTTPSGEPINLRGCGVNTETNIIESAFVEQSGILVIELENTNFSGDWETRTGEDSSGNAYIEFMGTDNFNLPDVDTIVIPIIINNPGIYRFQWRNLIGEGDSPTEANDSWLRIESDNFFGQKISDSQGDLPVGHIVCPGGQLESNRCSGEEPEGSSRLGWFKAYRTGGPTNAWVWRVFTNDFDPHAIFAEFDEAGRYDLLISGRSFGHAIDRLVLYRSENPSDNISEDNATQLSILESERQPIP